LLLAPAGGGGVDDGGGSFPKDLHEMLLGGQPRAAVGAEPWVQSGWGSGGVRSVGVHPLSVGINFTLSFGWCFYRGKKTCFHHPTCFVFF